MGPWSGHPLPSREPKSTAIRCVCCGTLAGPFTEASTGEMVCTNKDACLSRRERLASPAPATIGDSRRMRRVLLVLLTGAGELSSYGISRIAGVRHRAAERALAQLARRQWVSSGAEEYYRLTPKGRVYAIHLLGLDMEA